MKSCYCLIYVVKNNFDDRVYVGQTWQSLPRRFYEHINQKKCIKLYNAVKKYGEDKFFIQLLLVCSSQEVADYWEQYFIEKYDSISSGFNIRNGGSKGRHTQSTKDKLSKAHLGKRVSPKTEFKKGRTGTSKLDQLKVKEIREKRANEGYSYPKLAQEYGVSIATIYFIVKNRTWTVQI